MCDTIVALGPATGNKGVLFGKNSDREPDEVQNITIYPRKKYKEGEQVKCTYISIPQAAETARIVLCQPFWMFGAEMGANEYGVAIGNEAIFTREKPAASGLTGMDLLRLALERGKSAREALDIIIQLLEKWGQGGNCGYRQKTVYMNSFLIADSHEAYVLETVKSWWAWKKINDFWSISNVISLGSDFDAASPGLIQNAVRKGWCRSESAFDFRTSYSDFVFTWGSKARARQACSRNILLQKRGSLTATDFMEILRNHGGKTDLRPDKFGWTVCVHAADKLVHPSQSVGSLVCSLSDNRKNIYVTGAANPCLSPFYPVFSPGTIIPAGYLEGGAEFNGEAYWWECERLHRKALWHFPEALKEIRPVIREYERDMLNEVEGTGAVLDQTSVNRYFSRARDLVREWGKKLDTLPQIKPGWLYRRYWQDYNRLNCIE